MKNVRFEKIHAGCYRASTKNLWKCDGEYAFCSGIVKRGKYWYEWTTNPYIAGRFATLKEWKEAVRKFYE